MKEQIKAPEKIQLNNEEIANLSDASFKTLGIRMLQELTGYFNSIKKDPGSNEGRIMWNKEKSTGNQQWWEGNWPQIKGLDQKEEINIQPEQNEETEFKKWED